jgi:pimeloyl-ACP methyl ester carboxylesterase
MNDSLPAPEIFQGAAGNALAADRFGSGNRPAILLHGGGQTRHAWSGAAASMAREGWVAYCLDQRGHGDSAWIADGDYRHTSFAADLQAVADLLSTRHGASPVAIGASFGGLIALLAQGLSARNRQRPLFRALVFVDITLRTDEAGADRIRGFMRANAAQGFASVEEAAESVAAYMPHRPRPRSTRGLQKNLRQRNGRWYWHWDPRFMDGEMRIDSDRDAVDADLIAAATGLDVPTLLVRGGSSELVHEEHARDFLALAQKAEYVDVAGARHMVAGDANDQFSAALVGFLRRT